MLRPTTTRPLPSTLTAAAPKSLDGTSDSKSFDGTSDSPPPPSLSSCAPLLSTAFLLPVKPRVSTIPLCRVAVPTLAVSSSLPGFPLATSCSLSLPLSTWALHRSPSPFRCPSRRNLATEAHFSSAPMSQSSLSQTHRASFPVPSNASPSIPRNDSECSSSRHTECACGNGCTEHSSVTAALTISASPRLREGCQTARAAGSAAACCVGSEGGIAIDSACFHYREEEGGSLLLD
mmetsp:Transcript_8521/g.19902  ORF Transcript_8521/g.19902 Transcript_8521/m.19902 type:complete len:234 (-) Transcript_8521:11-712(-)